MKWDLKVGGRFINDYEKAIIVLMLIALPILGIFEYHEFTAYQKELKEIQLKKFAGKIIELNDRGGLCVITINDKVSNMDLKCDLDAKSGFFDENQIGVGDSLSKEANNSHLTFYKPYQGKFVKCCEFNIYAR